MEFCDVIEGQIMRKQLSPEHTKSMVEFSTKKPQDRLNSIREGLGVRHRISDWVKYLYLLITCLQVLQYGQSEYVRVRTTSVYITHRRGISLPTYSKPTGIRNGRPNNTRPHDRKCTSFRSSKTALSREATHHCMSLPFTFLYQRKY